MLKAQKQELDELKKNIEEMYITKKPKPSREILNWIKIRNYAVKQNKFDKVEEANKEINKLQKKDESKFEKEKENKLLAEMNKMNHRHENEKNVLQMKKNSLIDMFNQTKNKNIEQIQKKFEAKMKELKNYQSFEMANFDKITKGITKPCARIQSIVSSTTGIKEDENDENNEMNNENNNEAVAQEQQKENENKEKEKEEQINNGEEENNINDNNINEAEENNENNNDIEGEEHNLEQENKNEEEGNENNNENEDEEEINNINIDNDE